MPSGSLPPGPDSGWGRHDPLLGVALIVVAGGIGFLGLFALLGWGVYRLLASL